MDAYKIKITSDDIERLGLHHVFTNGMANSNDEAINNQQSQQPMRMRYSTIIQAMEE